MVSHIKLHVPWINCKNVVSGVQFGELLILKEMLRKCDGGKYVLESGVRDGEVVR